MLKDKVVIGRVVKPQGIRGQIKIEPITDDAACFLDLKHVYVGDEHKARAVLGARVDSNGVFLTLDGMDTRDAAEALRGVFLHVARDTVKLPKGRYLIEELKGLSVRTEDGEPLGVLSDVLQHGAADVYVVDGVRPFQFPALKRVIASIDIESGVITLIKHLLDEVAVYED